VVDAAARVFVAHGYHRTQVQDVADVLGLAKGTLYGYAQNKAALFAAAVRYADGHEPVPVPAELPVPAPADGELAALVAGRLASELADLELARVLSDPTDVASTGLEAELASIITDLYRRLAKHQIAIKLVDRCAPELPDLAQVWFGSGRRAQVDALTEYLIRRQNTGALVLPGPAPLVARTIVEVTALWAVHCHFDPAPPAPGRPDPDPVDDTAVAAMLAEVFVRAMVPMAVATPDPC